MSDPRRGRSRFVAPDPGGLPTGGTLYGAALLRSLQEMGVPVERVSLERARETAPPAGSLTWVDSLYLTAVPELVSRWGRVGLCLHYLPSLVEQGTAWMPHHLRADERAALEAAGAVLVPSAFMEGVLERLGPLCPRRFVVEPGVDVLATPSPPAPRRGPLRAVMVANVLPGKGILPFLVALDAELPAPAAPPPLTLVITGSLDADPEYGAACRARVGGSAALTAAVQFTGALSPMAAQASVAGADVLVSASRMESYGMALAEAVALGTPLLARTGGNAAAHVRPEAGGTVVHDDRALARELVRLSLAPAESDARRRLAWNARRQRSWREAAADFLRGATP